MERVVGLYDAETFPNLSDQFCTDLDATLAPVHDETTTRDENGDGGGRGSSGFGGAGRVNNDAEGGLWLCCAAALFSFYALFL